MVQAGSLVTDIENGALDERFAALYGAGDEVLAFQRQRYIGAIQQFEKHYGTGHPLCVFSVPGRTELCGNHTDHQHGLVMAAAVNLDIIAVAAPNNGAEIRLRSQGYKGENRVNSAQLAMQPKEKGTSAALIRGVAAAMAAAGGRVGGFYAYTTSQVLQGSGLSSSAAFEVCVAAVLNGMYNAGRFTPVQLAQFGQHAENVFFGKPSGLMDQLACAVGGAVLIDFEDEDAPQVERYPFDLEKLGLRLVVVDTRGSHAGLTDEYTAIRQEMEQVAHFFGKRVLRQVAEQELFDSMAAVRAAVGDRALLRGLHYFGECQRVRTLARALQAGDVQGLLAVVVESGRSSYMYNQNAYVAATPRQQGLAVALAVSEKLLDGTGAWRLQGGGFAGTIQAFVPAQGQREYCAAMQALFGDGCCHPLLVRREGAVQLV